MDRQSDDLFSAVNWPTLDEEERRRIRRLNAQLADIEMWICRRGQRMMTAYWLALVQQRQPTNGRLEEDVRVAGSVLCLLDESHADFRDDLDNVVAQIEVPVFVAPGAGDRAFMADPCAAAFDGLHRGGQCWLFQDLYYRVLSRNTRRLTSIGTLWTQVVLVQEQLRRW